MLLTRPLGPLVLFFVSHMAITLALPASAADELHAALDAYWLRHPQAQALSARADAATAARSAARSWLAGAPTVSLSRLDERDGAGRETELELALPLAGDRSARQQQADASHDAIAAETASLRLSLAAELLRLNSERRHRETLHELARKRLQLAQSLQHDVEQKVGAGELARADFLLAKTETLAAETTLLAAEQTADEALSRWQLRVGHTRALPDQLNVPHAIPIDAHPQLLRAQALATAAGARARFEQRRSGDTELSLLMKREDDPLLDESINSAGVRLSVPLFAGANRDQSVATAHADRLLADAEAQQLRQTLEREKMQARSHWQRANQQMQLASEQQQLNEQSLQLAQAAFAAGETSLSELLRIQQRAFDSSETLSELVQQQRDALARLIEAEGVLP